MSKVNRNKVPWVAVLVQTVIAGLFVAAIFLIGPIFVQNKGNLATLMYYIILAAITIIWTLSMVILFIDVLVIRRKYPQLFANKQLAPSWVFHICSLLGVITSGVGFYATFTAPWVPLIDHTGWVMWIAAIAATSLLIGIVMYFIGNISSKGEEISDEELVNRVIS